MIKTVKTKATWESEMRVTAQTRDHTIVIDQPEQMGGSNAGANPMELFLISLGACLVNVAAIVAKQEQVNLRNFSIEIEGDFDVEFLMGKTDQGRPGFTDIRATVHIDADMTDEEKEAFFHRVDSRCPITDNILHKSKIVFSVK